LAAAGCAQKSLKGKKGGQGTREAIVFEEHWGPWMQPEKKPLEIKTGRISKKQPDAEKTEKRATSNRRRVNKSRGLKRQSDDEHNTFTSGRRRFWRSG